MGFGDIFKISQFKAEIEQLKTEHQKLLEDNQNLHTNNLKMQKHLSDIGAFSYLEIKEMITQAENEHSKKLNTLTAEYNVAHKAKENSLTKHINELNQHCENLTQREIDLNSIVAERSTELTKLVKSVKTQTNKLSRSKELVRAIEYSLTNYFYYEPGQSAFKLNPEQLAEIEELSPSVILKLHCMDVKDLRKSYRENDKQISSLLDKYSARYTTKANQAIYKLMVIALRAELQNILYDLKYEKLDKSLSDIKSVTEKYLIIAGEGNQSIVGTLTKFIGEIEYLFINAAKIEYNYYVKKEQAKQEQLAIREQMRQEAEERKALEVERKKVEQEESKYNTEIEKLKEQVSSAQSDQLDALNSRILELQSQLADVIVKKEEITNLANGKAGNVYVISNLGSFGDNVFKIGMTRRLDPQDRVNELGDASVPFKFDVHSFIFSEDAVGLEGRLHNILNNQRVNKVNTRKEFFHTTIDELESLITEIEPTAEFNRTMLAEEFRQSQSTTENYSSTYTPDEDIDDE